MYYIYMIRCKDNTIYTGITTDINRRINEHKNKEKNCAKYTLRHEFKKIESLWTTVDRKQASKLEYHIKKLTKAKKEELIIDNTKLREFLENKIEIENYQREILN